jgi:hypothetical protein
MEKFAKQIQKEALAIGACSPGMGDLLNAGDSKPALVQLYLKKLEFCLENDFPSNDFMREHGKGIMESFGIFLDDRINLTNYRKCVALGKTTGNVIVTSYGVSQVYAKHTSDLVIEASDNAFVMVYVYDDAKVTVNAHDRAKVHVNRYGGKIATANDGQAVVKVAEKK